MPNSDNYFQRKETWKMDIDKRNRILLSKKEAAKILNVDTRTINRWIASKALAATRLKGSNRIRVFYSSVIEMVDEEFQARFERDFKKLFKPPEGYR